MLELFVAGLILGASQCALSCGPLLVFYIAGAGQGWKEGIKATIAFSSSRLLAYTFLGAIAGLAGKSLVDLFEEGTFILWVQFATGIFVLLLGTLIIIGRNPHLHICHYLNRHTVDNSLLSMSILGFLIGIVPYCAPFLGILTYIAMVARDPLLGGLYGFLFGLGAALITPLIIVGPLAGLAPKIFKSPLLLQVFSRLSGLVLLLFGVRLILNIVGNL